MSEKIPGLYQAYLNSDEINKMDEIDLYIKIDETEQRVLQCRYNKLQGKLSEDLADEEYALEYLKYQTTRFGVEISKPQLGYRLTPGKSYYAWIAFYENHLKKRLTTEEFDTFKALKKEGKDISSYMPNGKWETLLEDNKNVPTVNGNYSLIYSSCKMSELLKNIQTRCDTDEFFVYIKKSLEFVQQRNKDFYNSFEQKLYELLLRFPLLKFKMNDGEGYTDIYDGIIAFPKKDVFRNNELMFVHEITHLFHGLLDNYEIPKEYEEVRVKLINSSPFIKAVINFMKKIVEEKKQYFNKLLEMFSNYNNNNAVLKIINSINSITYKKDDSSNNFRLYHKELDLLGNGKNLIIDYFPNNCILPYYRALTHVEGIFDSILLGAIKSGSRFNNSFIKGYGHTKEYFCEVPSFIELIADYTTIIAFNDEKLIGEINDILGDDMVVMLNDYTNKLFGLGKNKGKKK